MKRRNPIAMGLGLLIAAAAVAAGEAPPSYQPPSATVRLPRSADSWKQMVERDRRLAPASVKKPRKMVRPPRPTERVFVKDLPATTADNTFEPAVVTRPRLSPQSALAAPASAPPEFPLLGVSYDGVSRLDQFTDFGTGEAPPDTMGAVGYYEFVEIINGSFAVFDKYSGDWLSHVSLNSFFAANFDGVDYPREDTTDPRVIFDRDSGRWLASVMETASGGHVILAISDNDDPLGFWTKYLITVGEAGKDTDYPTLGADRNGIYIAVRIFPRNGSSYAKIAAVEKAPILAGNPADVQIFSHLTAMYGTPQPAVNLDNIGALAAAWFVGSSPYTFTGTDSVGLLYRTLVWRGAAGRRIPHLSGATYVPSPRFSDPQPALAWNTAPPIDTGDYRLLMAVIRSGRLWTCRNVGVNYRGTDTFPDRTASEWLVLALNGAYTFLAQRGRVYDGDVIDPYSFYYPSLTVNGQGHVAMAFSGSSSSTVVGAYCTGRLRGDRANAMRPVTLLRDGDDVYVTTDGAGLNRWGDYSATSLDPSDDMTFWTIQEFAAPFSTTYNQSTWGTHIAALLAPAPVLKPVSTRTRQGVQNVRIDLRGANFFDAGTKFPYGVTAEITGGSPNGIDNLTVIYVNPTWVRLRFDVAPDASPGWRDITLFNPDGQSASISSALYINPVVDLVVSQALTAGPAVAGEPLTWTVTVANQSLTTASNVRLTNVLSPSVTFVDTDSNRLALKVRNRLVFNLGSIAPGASVQVPITVVPMLWGRIGNRAVAGCDALDLRRGNNVSALVTLVGRPVTRGPALAVEDAVVTEGDAGYANLEFIVLLQPASAGFVRVPFATADGSAIAGSDYVPRSGALLFWPGQTRQRIIVKVVGDRLSELDETLQLVLSPPPNVKPTRLSATGVIRDDDRLGTQTFRNPAAMVIPESGHATPYPSTIVVNGLTGPASHVRVTLHDFWHTFPADVDALLVGPQGQAVMLMSGAGSSLSVGETAPVTLTFDDTADRLAPENAALVTGSFRPTDFKPDVRLDPPAPDRPYASELSVFDGKDPNGTWSLYVLDDTELEGGAITGGWSLMMVAANPLAEANLRAKPIIPANPPR